MTNLMFDQPSSTKDAQTLLKRMECVQDIFCYNITLQLGAPFKKWMEKHEALLKSLVRLVAREEKKIVKKGKNGRSKRQNSNLAS